MNIDKCENCEENTTCQDPMVFLTANVMIVLTVTELLVMTSMDMQHSIADKINVANLPHVPILLLHTIADVMLDIKVGYNCCNIDACELVIDHCSFDARCYDTLGSYTCQCNSGFSGDGKTCSNMNAYTEIDFCGQNSICNDEPGSYTCDCESELKSDNGGCENINECLFGVCGENATCKNNPSSYKCS